MPRPDFRTAWLSALAIPAFGALLLGAQAARTVRDGVYAEEQAKRGAATYQDACAQCHGPDLSGGGFAPALIDESFALRWLDHSVGELFTIVKGTMPADRPASLTDDQYAAIVAFLLQTNHYPAGQQPLSTNAAELKQIVFTKPAAQ